MTPEGGSLGDQVAMTENHMAGVSAGGAGWLLRAVPGAERTGREPRGSSSGSKQH